MTLDSQSFQKHINDLFHIVNTVYISSLFPQVFNEEKFHNLFPSPMNQLKYSYSKYLSPELHFFTVISIYHPSLKHSWVTVAFVWS